MPEFDIAATLGLLLFVLLLIGFNWMIVIGRRRKPPPVERQPMQGATLDHAEARRRLGELLHDYRVTGSCNIREGQVLPVTTPEMVSAFGHLLREAHRQMIERGAPANGFLYYTASVNGEIMFFPAGELAISDIPYIAQMLERKP